MSETNDEHQHPKRYTVTMQDRQWWGARVRLSLVGLASSKKDDELLIFLADGGLCSINYARVWMMTATPLESAHD